MSGLLVSCVLDSDLPSWLKPFAVALASFAADDGSQVFPSVARIARMAGRSERQAFRAMRVLRSAGIIEPLGRAAQRASVQYQFHARALPRVGDPEQLGFFPQAARTNSRRKTSRDGSFPQFPQAST